MRSVLITLLIASLAACGGEPEAAGPERRSAAGEVLGGAVTDDMLPLDTARSTSPPDPGALDGDTESTSGAADREPRAATPIPVLSEAPAPVMTMPADPEPLRTDDP